MTWNTCSGGRLSLRHFKYRLSQGLGDPSISFRGQMHAVPTKRLIPQIHRATQVQITKIRLAREAFGEHALQGPLLVEMPVANVR